jgi:hypothetical protein
LATILFSVLASFIVVLADRNLQKNTVSFFQQETNNIMPGGVKEGFVPSQPQSPSGSSPSILEVTFKKEIHGPSGSSPSILEVTFKKVEIPVGTKVRNF